MRTRKEIQESWSHNKKKHRHKWEKDYCGCPFCLTEHAVCECGDVKNLLTGKINDF